MENLINRLNQAIDIEYDSKNAEVDEIKNLPLEERVMKGDTISNIKAEFFPISNTASGIIFKKVTVRCKDNLSKFREGSPIVLHGHGHSFALDVLADNGNTMVLLSGYHVYSLPINLRESEGWELDIAKVDIRHIIKKSTAILSYNHEKKEYISGIFSGQILPKFSSIRLEEATQLVENTGLNAIQKRAFVQAYSTENYYLIQGPPGSGKTWLLAHLAIAFAKEGNKVLITAPTHTAINNALQKTSSLSQYQHIIKVGKSNQKENLNYNGSTAKNVADFRNSGYNNTSRGVIVGATCYSPHTRKLEFMDWDIVIVDEAGQLSVPLAVAGMVKGKKFIFIGDHKQLPPIISANQKDPIFSKSVFELLFQHAPGIMLDVTYRMNHAINRFPSKQFYKGELHPHPDNENWVLDVPQIFNKHNEILDPLKPEVLFSHFHQSQNTRSEFEATLCAELVEELLNNGISPDEIAVITPFRAQVRRINNALAIKIRNIDQGGNVFVDVIERMQGQERDVIIFSMATSNPIQAKQRAEFFFNPNRLNVAITRARKKRIVIASKELFGLNSPDSKLQGLIDIFRSFYKDAYLIEESDVGVDLF